MTSGTLSPMKSFASELQTEFPIELNNPHVIDPSQVMIGVLKSGKNQSQFNFTYQNRDDTKMIADLGESIFDIIKVTPDGVLVFFPSYVLMDKAHQLWKDRGIFDNVNYFVEPKKSSEFKHIRKEFQRS